MTALGRPPQIQDRRKRRQRGFVRDKGRWDAVRRQVMIRDGFRCRSCKSAGLLEVDHIQPVSQGGDEWEFTNLQTLCRGCHIAKTRRESGQHSPEYLAQIEAWEAEIEARPQLRRRG